MNLLLTNYCNRSCAYCFARGMIQGENHAHMDFDPRDLGKVVSFFKNSNQRKIDILGGEPTLHPEFRVIVERLLEEGFGVQIFTNGIIPPKVLSYIKTIPAHKFHSVVNINPPEEYRESEWEVLERTLETLGESASLGLNIDAVDFSFSHIYELIKSYNLKKYLRLGIAQPILGAANRYVPFHQYQDLTPRIMRLVQKANQRNVIVMFDCGFTLCMFTPAQLGQLYLAQARISFHCNAAIDIGPDLTIWHCFPLSGVENIKLDKYKDAQGVFDYYRKRMASYRRMGASERCRDCRYLLRGQCPGGCLAHTINRFKTG